jgi:hypothetical protein
MPLPGTRGVDLYIEPEPLGFPPERGLGQR